MSALCNSIDTDWKHKKQRTTTTRTTKKLHSNISKWSFFPAFCAFFSPNPTIRCYNQSEIPSRMRILWMCWLKILLKQQQQQKKWETRSAFVGRYVWHTKWLNSTRSMIFGQFVADPTHQFIENHNITTTVNCSLYQYWAIWEPLIRFNKFGRFGADSTYWNCVEKLVLFLWTNRWLIWMDFKWLKTLYKRISRNVYWWS